MKLVTIAYEQVNVIIKVTLVPKLHLYFNNIEKKLIKVELYKEPTAHKNHYMKKVMATTANFVEIVKEVNFFFEVAVKKIKANKIYLRNVNNCIIRGTNYKIVH